MTTFVPVGTLAELPAGGVLQCTAGGAEIAVVNCDGTLYAVDNICSHAYAELAKGEVDVDDCTIECPLHGSIFDLQSGRPRTLPATQPIRVYPVKIVDGEVQVGVS